MRRYLLIAALVIWVLLPFEANANVAVEVGVFYDALAPYGDWIYLDSYGVWVWRPVGLWAGWQPYTYGRWEWSDEYGWIWISYFEWGWAPFHYGRWFYHDYYGWLWVPGTIWRPHWVVWIHSGPYVGWYPYYPSFIYIDYYSPVVYERWVIVEAGQINSGKYRHNAIPQDKRAQVFGSESGVHKYIPKEDDNSYHSYGPPKQEIEKYSAKKIEPVKTEFVSKPVNLYRPQERKFELYKPDFKSQVGDIGKLKDTNFNKQVLSPQTGQGNLPSYKPDAAFSPKYSYPLGSSFERAEKGYQYNNLNKQNFTPKNRPVDYQSPKGVYNYKSDDSYSSDGKILREDAAKSYSPSGQKNFYLPSSGSSDDDDDDNAFKKSVPKFSPKSSTVPKSVPQLKGK